MRVYVPNESFDRAVALLESRHVCVISGIPGIGKSTLAQVLAARYSGAGYELVEISEDANEANRMWDNAVPQFFYYDDFLGQTNLVDKLHKNEDNRLLSLMRRISKAKGKRLILTTREYILAQAKERYERLSRQDFSPFTCILDLADYTYSIRAKILYNHIYFSALPRDAKASFAEPLAYNPIIHHPNFSPRLVHHSIELIDHTEPDGPAPPAAVLDILNKPQRLWDHVVNNQLAGADVELLEVMYTFRSPARLQDLAQAWVRYSGNATTGARPMKRSIKVLEHTMLRVAIVDQETTIAYHNPSVRDYFRDYFLERQDVFDAC